MKTQNNKNFVITKKIAKHGNQSIIIIPRMLEYHLKPGMIVELGINIISEKIEKKNLVEEEEI